MNVKRKAKRIVNGVDPKESAETELARKYHLQLFPEEYDNILDSNVDARLRSVGINPMSESYINQTNQRRTRLGFSPFSVSGDNDNTYLWVLEKVKQGDDFFLLDLISKHQNFT
jgi:hypothetical protein